MRYRDAIAEIKRLDARVESLEVEVEELRWEETEKIFNLVTGITTGEKYNQTKVAADTGITQQTVSRHVKAWRVRQDHYADGVTITHAEAMLEARGGTTRSEEGYRAEMNRRSGEEIYREMPPEKQRDFDRAAEASAPPSKMERMAERVAQEPEARKRGMGMHIDIWRRLNGAYRLVREAHEFAEAMTDPDDETTKMAEDFAVKIKTALDAVLLEVKGVPHDIDWDAEAAELR